MAARARNTTKVPSAMSMMPSNAHAATRMAPTPMSLRKMPLTSSQKSSENVPGTKKEENVSARCFDSAPSIGRDRATQEAPEPGDAESAGAQPMPLDTSATTKKPGRQASASKMRPALLKTFLAATCFMAHLLDPLVAYHECRWAWRTRDGCGASLAAS